MADFEDLLNAIRGNTPMPTKIEDTLTVALTGEAGSVYLGHGETVCLPDEWITLFRFQVKVEVPRIGEEALVEKVVESLEAQIKKTQAEAQVKINQLEERIQNLRALTWDRAQATD